MDFTQVVQQLEEACNIIQSCADPSKRQAAEKFIYEFRSQEDPFELCQYILNTSKNDYLIFETSKCLSLAILSCWDVKFSQNTDILVKLISFIIDWSNLNEKNVAEFAYKRCLNLIAVILRVSWIKHVSNDSSSPGERCAVLDLFIQSVRGLISTSEDGSINRLKIGLIIIQCVFEEFSCSADSLEIKNLIGVQFILYTQFERDFIHALFQDLLRIGKFITTSFKENKSAESFEYLQNISVRYIRCMDMIFSWSYTPNDLYDFNLISTYSRSRDQTVVFPFYFRDVINSQNVNQILSIFYELHQMVRNNASYGSITLNIINSFSSSKLSIPRDKMNNLEIVLDQIKGILVWFRFVFKIMFNDFQGFSLINDLEGTNISPEERALCNGVSQEVIQAFANEVHISPDWVPNLAIYELPIISDLFTNILKKTNLLFKLSRNLNTCQDEQVLKLTIENFLHIEVFFRAMIKFILKLFEIEHASGTLNKARNQPNSIHGSIEKSLTVMNDFISLVDDFDISQGEDFSFGKNRMKNFHLIPLQLVVKRIKENSQVIFEAYLKSRLSQSAGGLRDSPISGKMNAFDNEVFEDSDEEIDEEYDLSDFVFYEESLSSLPRFSFPSIDNNILTLTNIIHEQSGRLMSFGEKLSNDDPKVYPILEDLHWLLMISGHLIAMGESTIDTKADIFHHDSFTMPECLVTASSAFKIKQNYSQSNTITLLHEAFSNQPQSLSWPLQNPESDIHSCLPVYRLIASVARLWWLHANNNIGSDQILQDIIWFFTRTLLELLGEKIHEDPNVVRSLLDESVIMQPCGNKKKLSEVIVFSSIKLIQLSITNWSSSENVVRAAAIFLSKVKFFKIPKEAFKSEIWINLCRALITPDAIDTSWMSFKPEILFLLIESSLHGLWTINSNSEGRLLINENDMSNEFIQAFTSLKQNVGIIIERISHQVNIRSISEKDVTIFNNCYTVVSAMAKVILWFDFSPCNFLGDLLNFIYGYIEKSIEIFRQTINFFPDITMLILKFFDYFIKKILYNLMAKTTDMPHKIHVIIQLHKVTYYFCQSHLMNGNNKKEESLFEEMNIILDLYSELAAQLDLLRCFIEKDNLYVGDIESFGNLKPKKLIDFTFVGIAQLMPIIIKFGLKNDQIASKLMYIFIILGDQDLDSFTILPDEILNQIGKLFIEFLSHDEYLVRTQLHCLQLINLVGMFRRTYELSYNSVLVKKLGLENNLDLLLILFKMTIQTTYKLEYEEFLSEAILVMLKFNVQHLDRLKQEILSTCSREVQREQLSPHLDIILAYGQSNTENSHSQMADFTASFLKFISIWRSFCVSTLR